MEISCSWKSSFLGIRVPRASLDDIKVFSGNGLAGFREGWRGCVWKYNEMQRAAGSLRRTSISSLASVFIFLCFYFLHNLNLDEGI